MDIEKQAKKIGPGIHTFIFSVNGEPKTPFIKVNGNASFGFGLNWSMFLGSREISDFRFSNARDKGVEG